MANWPLWPEIAADEARQYSPFEQAFVSHSLVFILSFVATVLVSAFLLWWGTKLIAGIVVKVETVFWVAFVTQFYRCVATLVMQYILPHHSLVAFSLILCGMVYVQGLVLRLAVGVGYHEISWSKSQLVSFLAVLIGFVGVMPVIAWSVSRIVG